MQPCRSPRKVSRGLGGIMICYRCKTTPCCPASCILMLSKGSLLKYRHTHANAPKKGITTYYYSWYNWGKQAQTGWYPKAFASCWDWCPPTRAEHKDHSHPSAACDSRWQKDLWAFWSVLCLVKELQRGWPGAGIRVLEQGDLVCIPESSQTSLLCYSAALLLVFLLTKNS